MDQKLREAERALLASDSPTDKARLEAAHVRLGEFPAPWWREFEVVEELNHNGLPRLLRVAHLETRAEQLVRLYTPERFWNARVERRLRRAYALRRRLAHATVPAVYTAEFSESPSGEQCFVEREDFVPGQSAWDLNRSYGRLAWRGSVTAARQVALGLIAIREARLVHSHLHPRHVLIDSNWQTRIVGWKNVRPLPGHPDYQRLLTRDSGGYAAGYYLAPEHLRLGVESLTTASDVYSLCATLFHMLTNRHPFSGETGIQRMRKIMEQPTPDPREFAPDLPADLVTVILRGMQKDPAQRPSPEALAAGLAAVFAGAPLPADFAPPRQGVLGSVLGAFRQRRP